jgi:hypothetical protein
MRRISKEVIQPEGLKWRAERQGVYSAESAEGRYTIFKHSDFGARSCSLHWVPYDGLSLDPLAESTTEILYQSRRFKLLMQAAEIDAVTRATYS